MTENTAGRDQDGLLVPGQPVMVDCNQCQAVTDINAGAGCRKKQSNSQIISIFTPA